MVENINKNASENELREELKNLQKQKLDLENQLVLRKKQLCSEKDEQSSKLKKDNEEAKKKAKEDLPPEGKKLLDDLHNHFCEEKGAGAFVAIFLAFAGIFTLICYLTDFTIPIDKPFFRYSLAICVNCILSRSILTAINSKHKKAYTEILGNEIIKNYNKEIDMLKQQFIEEQNSIETRFKENTEAAEKATAELLTPIEEKIEGIETELFAYDNPNTVFLYITRDAPLFDFDADNYYEIYVNGILFTSTKEKNVLSIKINQGITNFRILEVVHKINFKTGEKYEYGTREVWVFQAESDKTPSFIHINNGKKQVHYRELTLHDFLQITGN